MPPKEPPAVVASEPPLKSKPLTIFISYVHTDYAVSSALKDALKDAFGHHVDVLIDRAFIEQGEEVRKTIEQKLEAANVLVVVNTGGDSPKYWAGYEIGYFQRAHQGQAPPGRPHWGRIVVFCAKTAVPPPLEERKYIDLGLSDSDLHRTQAEYDKSLTVSDDDPIFLWFKTIYEAINGEQLKSKTDDEDFRGFICKFHKKVFAEFKRRPSCIFRPQKQLIVRFDSKARVNAEYLLGTEATINLIGGARSVFGISVGDSDAAAIPWSNFCNALLRHPMAEFYKGTIVRMIWRAASENIAEAGNLITSYDNKFLYRLILTSCTTYYNDFIEASIYLIDVFRREDYGKPDTTQLAKALQLVARFRSLFLELPSRFHWLNIERGKENLSDVCRQITTELDILNVESIEANLHQPASWTNILEVSQIQMMAQVWEPLKKELLVKCAAGMAADGPTTEASARTELVDVLKRLREKMGPINETVLDAIAKKLVELSKESEEQRQRDESQSPPG